MIVFLDTNVILDIFLKREPFFQDSYACLGKLLVTHTETYLSATAITDIHYLLRKGLKQPAKAKETLKKLFFLVQVADTRALDLEKALESPMPDFEDAVLAEIALRCEADYIISRNLRDFKFSPVPAISPADFIKQDVL